MAPISFEETWQRSDQYHNSFLLPQDDILDAAVKNSNAQGLPNIAVSTAQAKFLYLLAKTMGAKRILEVGTLAGYSTIFLARALPADGKLITLELIPHNAKVAEENIKSAGLAEQVSVIVGPAADSLTKLHPEQPFDLIFIDADKPLIPFYFAEAKRLVRPGGVIIVDNVVWRGLVSDPDYTDEDVEGVRKLLRHLKDDDEIEATTIATAGEKGYDGFIYAIRK